MVVKEFLRRYSLRCVRLLTLGVSGNRIRAALRRIARFCSQNFADRRKNREKQIPSRMRVEWSDALLSLRALGRTTGFAYACFLAMVFSGRLFG
jgi:hypothetical protein